MKTTDNKITPEQKRKYIAYAIIGIFVLGIIIYGVNDFLASDKNKKIEEFTTPESEANKYNSKTEALNGGKKQDTTIKGDLLNEPKNPDIESLEKTETNYSKIEIKEETKSGIKKKKFTKAQTLVESPKEKTKPVKEEPVPGPYTQQPKQKFNSDNINNFFKSNKSKTGSQNIVYATIKGDQIGIKNNQRVTLITSKEVTINDKIIPKNSLVYAKATFTDNRVNLTVTNINQIYLIFSAYDVQDGNLGLQVNQSLINESANSVIDNQADNLGVSEIPVVGRTLSKVLRKKVKEIKVDLLDNQKVILKTNMR